MQKEGARMIQKPVRDHIRDLIIIHAMKELDFDRDIFRKELGKYLDDCIKKDLIPIGDVRATLVDIKADLHKEEDIVYSKIIKQIDNYLRGMSNITSFFAGRRKTDG
jgi:hypothetical protein